MRLRFLALAWLAALALAGCCGEGENDNTLFSAVCLDEQEEQAEPNSGLWTNPQENGRGFYVERDEDQLSVSAYVFEEDGRATWYSGRANRQADGRYSGTLLRSTGGQTLTGSYEAPDAKSEVASMLLDFDTAATGKLELQLAASGDKHTITLEQFRGDGGPPSNATFSNGTWWNPDESGRTFAIEVQGNNVTFHGFVFEEGGEPVWYSGRGTLATTSSFTLTLSQMAGGQTLTGTYRQPTTLSTPIGNVTFQARASDRATLTLPNGRQVQLQRLLF